MNRETVEIRGLAKTFSSGVFRKRENPVLEGIDLSIREGRTLGMVGDSGCGKTTLARCILRLIPADGGEVFLEGEDVLRADPRRLKLLRRKMQIIFQHPYSALDPRLTLEASIREPMDLHEVPEKGCRSGRVRELLDLVNLHPEILSRRPHEVSGGQLQRAVIARALALNPSFLILDEPTSMLDVSVQATVLDLLKKLQEALGLSYLFISHDFEVVRFMSHEISRLEEGRIIRDMPY